MNNGNVVLLLLEKHCRMVYATNNCNIVYIMYVNQLEQLIIIGTVYILRVNLGYNTEINKRKLLTNISHLLLRL